MSFHTVNEISIGDLVAMADGHLQDTVSDRDFFETLAAFSCIVVGPWIMRVHPSGGLTRLTRVFYDTDGELNKARMLVDAARQLERSINPRLARFGF